MAALLKQAVLPNLVQTLEGNPAIVHGGPFANIAHGCSSVAATRAALRLGDYCVTEAGFGADLGAEKFLDIKCRMADIWPDAAVLVATVRALKLHGGADYSLLEQEDISALERGLSNLLHHIRTLRDTFGLPVVVALNRFVSDTPAELALVEKACAAFGTPVALSQVWEKGGAGGLDLAEKVIAAAECAGQNTAPSFAYDLSLPLREKLLAVTKRVYGGASVTLTPRAEQELRDLKRLGFGGLPVCIAKTQYSLSDDAKKLGAPEDFTLTVRSLRVSAGAGFVVALTGEIMTMPGLPKHPAAENIDISESGVITGLF